MFININSETIASSADQTMMMSPPPSNESSVIIFDWDDTILPSSFVDRSQSDNLSELPPQTRALFREIEVCTEKCLEAAASYGEVSNENPEATSSNRTKFEFLSQARSSNIVHMPFFHLKSSNPSILPW